MTAEQIKLARAAIVARVAFWDALGAFEKATTDNGEWPDRINDAVITTIDNIAACAGETAADPEYVTDADLSLQLSTMIGQKR